MVVQRFTRFRTSLGNLRISQDICYGRVTDNNDFLTIYGHRASLLNNKTGYQRPDASINWTCFLMTLNGGIKCTDVSAILPSSRWHEEIFFVPPLRRQYCRNVGAFYTAI